MAIYRDELLFLENMELDMMKIYIFSLFFFFICFLIQIADAERLLVLS